MNIQHLTLSSLILASVVILTACQNRPPVPEPRYIPNLTLADSEVLEVLPYRGACHSETPMQCLLVKPVGAGDEAIFGIGYNHIIGFEPAMNTSYTIKVRQQIDQNTQKPTGLWQLEEILLQRR